MSKVDEGWGKIECRVCGAFQDWGTMFRDLQREVSVSWLSVFRSCVSHTTYTDTIVDSDTQ